MKTVCRLLQQALRACALRSLPPTRYVLAVDIARQAVFLFARPASGAAADRRHKLVRTFRCSTSRFGVGETAHSYKTPRGLHRIANKIGGGWPAGTAFASRRVTGFTWRGQPKAPITTRIFWLEGLEPGLNRGGDIDSHARYIYIHGTSNELTLGRPDSRGCIHLAAADLIPLYDLLPEGTLVWITGR
jgi:hypothetical protein